jgi:rare lipoprotein A (peptidoglycan hydrolase)
VTVPVVDRGPYVAGREWDLTGATKARLRFPSTGTVWSTR